MAAIKCRHFLTKVFSLNKSTLAYLRTYGDGISGLQLAQKCEFLAPRVSLMLKAHIFEFGKIAFDEAVESDQVIGVFFILGVLRVRECRLGKSALARALISVIRFPPSHRFSKLGMQFLLNASIDAI